MAHVVLPSRDKKDQRTPHLVGKYANSAIEFLLENFRKKKLNPKDAIIKLTGGSQMFKNASKGILNIADRNIKSITEELDKHGLKVSKKDLGGSKGRTIFFFLETGEIKIYFAGGKFKTQI